MLAKIESTYGTDPTPTAGSNLIAITKKGVSFSPKFTHIHRSILDGTLDLVSGTNVLPQVDFNFEVEIRGNRTDGSAADISSGTIGHALEIDCLLQACDLSATYTAEVTPGVSRDGYVTYNPIVPTDQGKSVTIYFYSGLKLHKITGCKGTVKGALQAGQFGMLTFDMKGIYNSVTDASIPGGLTFLNTKPAIFTSSASTVDSFSPVFQKLDFDLGNKVDQRLDANSTNGVAGFLITDRTPKAAIDPESVAEATSPIWGDLSASTTRTITANIGTQSGNKFSAILKGVSEAVAYADRQGIRIQNINYSLERQNLTDVGGNMLALKFG